MKPVDRKKMIGTMLATRGIGAGPYGPQEDSPGWDPKLHGNKRKGKKKYPK
jgi:hypothetical protein